MRVAKYTKSQVKTLRAARSFAKSNGSSKFITTDKEYQAYLGELKGAGHLQVNGYQSLQTNSQPNIMGTGYKEMQLTFNIPLKGGSKDKPHFTGYLQSAADVDSKPYKVKGWLNEGGSIRLEIVK